MITADALNALISTVQNANVNDVQKVSQEPSNVYFLLNRKTGELERKVAPIYLNTTAETIPSLIEQSLTLATENECNVKVYFTPGNNKNSASELSSGALVYAVIGNNTVIQRVSHSDQFLTLQGWAANKDGATLTQGQFYTLLRTQFYGCLTAESQILIQAIKDLDFKAEQQMRSEMAAQKTSVSRKLTAEIKSSVEIPEMFTFEIPVYRGNFSTITAAIRMALMVDAEQQRFKLHVLPGQIDDAIEMAAHTIHNRLVMQVSGFPANIAVVDVVVSPEGTPPPETEQTTTGDADQDQAYPIMASPVIFHVARGQGPVVAKNGI